MAIMDITFMRSFLSHDDPDVSRAFFRNLIRIRESRNG